MTPTVRAVLFGAFFGSIAVAATLALLVLVGVIPMAGYAASWTAVAGGGWVAAALLGGAVFVLIGTLWGLPFAWVPRPTIPKAWLWALVPTAWALVGWPLVLGNPLFAGGDPKGLVLTFLMNVGIWGTILGAYARRPTLAVR